ncbi:TonB-dependent receptor [Erythrobacter sp. HA6-11]
MRFSFAGSAGSPRYALLAGVAATAMSVPSVAFAQDAAGDVTAEEEAEEFDNVIVVTATKREQTLQETPISVSVTSGETLEQAQIRDVLDLQTVAPSLRVSQLQSSSNTTFFIRGFGNGANNFGLEPSVGVFIDGVYRSRSAGALSDLANVQRIEVLRGPQSTLFGKNASAGVISVVTREPQFEFGGSIEASYGNFDALILKADVTGPLGDSVAWSLDGSYNRRDGYANIVNLDEDLSDRNRWSARGQLLIEPSPDLKARIIADYAKIDEVCCTVGNILNGPTGAAIFGVGGAIDPENLFSYDTFLSQAPKNIVDNYGISGQIDWNVGALSVTSITSYRKLENFFDQDIDFTSADLASEFRDQDVKTFTQEVRVASDFDGPFNFLLGGYFFDESIEQESEIATGGDFRQYGEFLAAAATGDPTFSFNTIEGALGLAQDSIFTTPLLTSEEYSMENQAWSIFGTFDFEPFDGLVLTAGFNYTDDKKDFALSQTSFDPLANVNLVDAFITIASGGTITTRDQFLALPQANQDALAAGALNPLVNPFLGLADFQFQPPFLNLPNAIEDGRTRDDDFSYTLRAAYDLSDRLNVYLSYATGFKASSVNLSRDSRPAFGDFIPGPIPTNPATMDPLNAVLGGSNFLAPSSPITDAGLPITNLSTGSRFAGPEDATVWEIGLKGNLPGVGFNLAIFDQELEGFQDFLFTGTGFQLTNAGKQSVRGFEFDTTITPADPLVLTFAITHLDPLFDEFVDGPAGDLSGQRPAGIPSWAISTSATYTHEFNSGARLISRVDYNHESNVQILTAVGGFGSLENNVAIARNYTREINLVNASMTLALNNGLELGLWGRNLFDDQYISTIFPSVAQAGSISGYPSVPRTYGALVRFKF